MSFDRRSMLKGTAGLFAGAGLAGQGLARSPRMRIGVVGGGIIGCSIAMHLAEAGAEVTLFEKNILASGATKNSVAWINPVVLDEHYMKLRLLSMAHWRALDRRLPTRVIWGGSVSWTRGDRKGDTLRAKAEMLRKIGGSLEMLPDAQAIMRMAPEVRTLGEVSAAMYLAQDGHVDPVAVTDVFAAAARRGGAQIVELCEVRKVERTAGKLSGVVTSKGAFPLDQIIFVGGTDTPKLMAMVDVPFKLANAPGLVVHTRSRPVVTRMVFEASGEFEFKQYADGRILTSFTSGPPDLPQHAEIRAHPMDYPSEELKDWHGRMLIERTAAYLPAVAGAEPDAILLGFRPMPLDRLPTVGPVPGQPGCYVVVTHSGITLAPILGDHVAREVYGQTPMEMLAPYRPDRFVSKA